MRRELFQKQLENDDLRNRLQYLEAVTGKDSYSIASSITPETEKIDWVKVLLDSNTDDLIISVSREKIANEIIKLR